MIYIYILGVIIFGSVRFLSKKKKLNRNFFLKKPKLGQTGLARFFPVLVRFGFFGFLLIKPKPNRTGWFFQNFYRFNRFFFQFGFFSFFFLIFSV